MAAISRLYVSSDDLHAFIDEMLPPRAATRVASALEQDEAARKPSRGLCATEGRPEGAL